MKSILLFVVVSLLTTLVGCSQIQAKFNAQVQAASVPDLTAALAAANAAVPPDTDGAACWSDVLAYVNALPTAGSAPSVPQIVGVASAIEASRGLNLAQPIAIPPIPAQLHRDCAVVVIDAQQLAAKLGLTAAALGKGIPVVKGLEVLQSMPVKP